jgi:hypothetical protein
MLNDKAHPCGVRCFEIAEYMPFNLGSAFALLWHGGMRQDDATGDLQMALEFLHRFENQRYPIPSMPPMHFRTMMMGKRGIFNRPSPWCESVRHALAAMCDICSSDEIREKCRLTVKAIACVKQALEDERCLGRAMTP